MQLVKYVLTASTDWEAKSKQTITTLPTLGYGNTSLHLVDNWPLNFKQHIWHCCFPHNFVKNLFPFCTLFQCANAGEMKVNWNESRGNATRILNFCIFILSCKSKKSFQDVLNFLQNWVTITFWKHNSDFGCFNFCFYISANTLRWHSATWRGGFLSKWGFCAHCWTMGDLSSFGIVQSFLKQWGFIF